MSAEPAAAGNGARPASAARGHAFGLAVEATYALPGLRSATGGDFKARPVRLDLVSDAELTAAWPDEDSVEARRILTGDGRVGILTKRHPAAGFLIAEEHGRHLVSADGRHIRSAPDEEAGDRWQNVLVGHALPIAATLHGLEVLHASAVVLGGQAVAFTGPSGAGKSTVATGLLLSGARFFSDDVLAVEGRSGRVLAHAGIGITRLWPQAAQGAQGAITALAAHRLGEAYAGGLKTHVDVKRDVASLPLASLYVLERARDGEAAGIERLTPDGRLLLGSTHNVSVTAAERLVRHLDLMALLADRVRMYKARSVAGAQAELIRLAFEHASHDALG